MSKQISPQAHKVSIAPEDDARLPILEAQIENQWMQYRQSYCRMLKKDGSLQREIKRTALNCVLALHQAEERGLNPDQGRELIRDLIIP